jgi:glycosyltransferase involved in cell wall biosynthesis
MPAGVIAYLMMKIFKIKYVISVHGGEVAPLKNSKTLRKLVVNVLNSSTKVIVNGGFTENEFLKMGVQKNKLKIIHGPPNYVKHIRDNDLLTEFRDKITNKEGKIILCVTRLTEVKGTRYLIEAIPHLKSQNIHCLIVGNGELLSELQKLVNSLNISEKVTFFGYANKKELGMIYDVSDVFVLPSIIDSTGATDAMPLVIPEAMESKLPVIGTKVGGIPFMISNNENGLTVEPKDSILLAQAIDKVLLDEELRDRIIANSQELVKTRTLQSTHDKYIEIINESITKEEFV